MQPRVDLAAERLEQAELAEPLDPVGAQTAELVEDPLARRPGEERGLRARQLLGRRVEPEAELALEPHPALKAISTQASPADMWLGDDFHHNGAFRLSYAFESVTVRSAFRSIASRPSNGSR